MNLEPLFGLLIGIGCIWVSWQLAAWIDDIIDRWRK